MNPRERPNNDPVELAIGRVLEAERAARQSIADAHAFAQARLASAHAQALQIAERADGRLARARRSVESRIAARQARSRSEDPGAARRRRGAPGRQRAHRPAVAAVAAAITGAGPR